ncbi:MAG: hypothetical protein WCI51_03735 [Lentisphaerota bacterium]
MKHKKIEHVTENTEIKAVFPPELYNILADYANINFTSIQAVLCHTTATMIKPKLDELRK